MLRFGSAASPGRWQRKGVAQAGETLDGGKGAVVLHRVGTEHLNVSVGKDVLWGGDEWG